MAMEQKRVLMASAAAIVMLGAGAFAVGYGMSMQAAPPQVAANDITVPQSGDTADVAATPKPTQEQRVTAQLNRQQVRARTALRQTADAQSDVPQGPLPQHNQNWGGEPGAPIPGNTSPVARVFDRIGNEIDEAVDARTPVKADEMRHTVALNAIDDPQDVLAQVQIKNRKGEVLGSVNSLSMAKSGKIESVRADIGGFLGLGEHVVAIPVNHVVYLPDRKLLVTDMSRDDLKALHAEPAKNGESNT
jgi:hypothetical protein